MSDYKEEKLIEMTPLEEVLDSIKSEAGRDILRDNVSPNFGASKDEHGYRSWVELSWGSMVMLIRQIEDEAIIQNSIEENDD